jgi:O-antigen/teichoic acid export membrane protein
MIKYMIDAKNLGVYAIGVTLAELVFLVPSSVTSALSGRLFNIDDKSNEKRTITCKTVKYTFYISLIIIIIGISLLRFIPLIYGEEYSGAAEVTLILFTGIIFASIAKVSYSYFFVSGRPIVHLSFTFLSFTANIILNYFLIPVYGINGAAFASTVSYALYGSLYIIYFVVKEKFKPGDFFKIGRDDILMLKGLIRK